MNAKLALETLSQEMESENRIQEGLVLIIDDQDMIPSEIVINARTLSADQLRETIAPLFVP